ncbi:GGDEF domain-containing protein [Candidatus Ferrigenium straubiae]|jgi:diguanylate cyclase (GGDEF)-like protein|uniref:GGDEF domain-containing protein n=1 Tax=Candidatus Ferrigenium straubiae TaxID=2919506 RepID=UPI003F4ABA32
MNLDPRTLLFSLMLVYALSVLALFLAAYGRNGGGRHDGMGKWAVAMLLETLVWTLIAARGIVPDVLSIIAANGLKAASHALILAAIYEFQRREAPRWQYWLPVALTLLQTTLLVDDLQGRFIWGGLVYGLQMALIARALLSDRETRAGRAWRVLFIGIVMIMLVLALRAALALFGLSEIAQPQKALPIHPVQLFTYVAVMATALLGSIGFVLMVKERTDREIMRLAMTDSLTRIPNRRALMEWAEHALARRDGAPLALLMIDVDHFKRINDTYGHPTGDEVLRKIAELLEGRLRGYDFMGRYGGEEFCVVAPDTDREGALALAESLRAIIHATPFTDAGKAIALSVSIGVALCPSNAKCELKEILAEADAALYAAKQAGRNRVVCFGMESA